MEILPRDVVDAIREAIHSESESEDTRWEKVQLFV